MEVSRREKQAGILPDSDVDAYMKVDMVDIQKVRLHVLEELIYFIFVVRQYQSRD